MTRSFLAPLAIVLAFGLAQPPRAIADDRADTLLNLLKKRPRNKSMESWLEERREAARELGRLKEKRAVPVLLQIIGKERFDVILEIAIDALGEIKDKRAVAPLKKLLTDPSLDAYVRDAVAGALKKLGEETAVKPVPGPGPRPGPGPGPGPGPKPGPGPEPGPGETPDPPDPQTRPAVQPDEKLDLATRLAKLAQPFGGLPPLDLKLDPDLIAFSDRWDLAAGTADVRWDKGAGQTSGAIHLASHLRRQMERKLYGYTIDGAFDLAFRAVDPVQAEASWSLDQSLEVRPEIRFYPFRSDLPLLFFQASGGVGYGLGYSSHPLYYDRRLSFGANLSIGGGPGYGRIYDIGGRIRLRRIAYLLKKSGLITTPIDKTVGDQLIHTWHHLRNRVGTFHHLGYTLDILQRAGLLGRDPVDPATVYKLIRILDDPQLDGRPNGMMFRLGYGYARTLVKDADDLDMGFLYATAEHAWQLSAIRSLESSLRFYYQMIGDPDSYGLTAQAAYTHYLYSSSYDPLGSLSASLSGGINNQPGAAFTDGGIGYQVLLGGGYTRYFTRGSRVNASLKVGLDSGSPILLFTLEASYGVAYGSFAPSE
jgi:hypothetical protein